MSQAQINTAHTFIKAGADAILGAHPHVIEPIEIYKGKAIFYSMGNFIFDQPSNAPTGKGLAIGISITPTNVSYFIYPINIKRQQASLMEDPERLNLLNSLAEKSIASVEEKENIKNGIINLNRQ